MRRGDVWRVSFEGSLGGEIRKSRPAVILSNNAANQHANRIQIVPFSSKTGKLYPCDTTVTMNGAVSKGDGGSNHDGDENAALGTGRTT